MAKPDFHATPAGRVDRRATVERHRVRLTALDSRSPLQVGNGEFAAAVDVTGLQTLPDSYPVDGGGTLLGTQSQWAWHSTPSGERFGLDDTYRWYSGPAGEVSYPDLRHDLHDAADQSPAETWLRSNPHRLDLARVGLWTPGGLSVDTIADIDQQLDLWTGIVTSRFSHGGSGYRVTTAAHPERNALGISVDGPPGREAGLRLRFPYGSQAWGDAADWSRPHAHTTEVERTPVGWRIKRTLDRTVYWLSICMPGFELIELGDHDLMLRGMGDLGVVIEFGPQPVSDAPESPDTVFEASRRHWARFWNSGAAIELASSDHSQAVELERRIVLSQYLTAVNCAGTTPPAETGLMLNSWRGKFHLEMHWFHAAHFTTWGRPELLERSMAWYERIRRVARETAARQRLAGARWPKQVGPEGRETPSSIGPFLVWQQPHPIHLAELLYRAEPETAILEKWADLVFDTAEFMASYAAAGPDGFELGPPIVPAQESYYQTRATAKNPTFELAYWCWALEVAAEWRRRLGAPVPERWRAVSRGLARPAVVDGGYAALATPPYLVRNDHPSMLGALGIVPASRVIDPAVMNRTFDDVWNDWGWDTTWGWDYPMAAMTATRLGRPDDAIAALLAARTKNTYLVNGHNRQTGALPVYLPGNGGLLMAAALMTAGWDGGPPQPGFGPGWRVSHEGFVRLP